MIKVTDYKEYIKALRGDGANSFDRQALLPEDSFLIRPDTKFIIIHDTRTLTPGETQSYHTKEGLMRLYNARFIKDIGAHFLINYLHSRKRDNPIIEAARPLLAPGNHAGLFYDLYSIGIFFIGHFDFVVAPEPLLNKNVAYFIRDLALTFDIPASGVLASSEAYALLFAGYYESPDSQEIIERYWNRSPGIFIGRKMVTLRNFLINSGVDIGNPDVLAFINSFSRKIYEKKYPIMRAAQRTQKRIENKMAREVDKFLKEKAQRRLALKKILKRLPRDEKEQLKEFLNFTREIEELAL